uniref:Uncharacterized protein n=1 Tax=Globisporangium ultimum (strain ATCC 200006 / CBS 805.95 / DAOM BR144) TaxID=431595 RepID=K3W4Y5_GLOUD
MIPLLLPSELLFVSTFNSNRGHEGNPHVQAIQSRVADLVRRYDESVSGSDGTSLGDDDGHINVPSRWKVGDVLMVTHNALVKTGTRTERTIIAEFRDDPEVIEALGNGERNFARVVEEAAQQTQQMHQMFEKTIAIVKQLQRTDEELRLHESRTAGEQWQQVRELKITIEALQKEKSMVLGQLQEQLKTHKELLVAMDEQNQELKKTQIAMMMKADEMNMLRDDFERHVAEAQRALGTSQQSVSMWREKFQASTKAIVAADQKVAEMEKKIHSQAEEIIKHEVVFQAKTQEEKHKEKVRDGEVQRLHGEVAAAMQKIAELEDGKARKNENSNQVRASLMKEKQELLNKLEQAESTIRELQARLSDELSSKNQFQNDNNELSRLVLEMKDRAREVMNKVPLMGPMPGRSGGALLKKAASFAISLRALSIMGSEPKLQSSDEDDGLSTSSDDDDSEIGKEDVELSATVQQVVTSAFPQHQRVVEQSDENIVQNIARYEDPKNTPMNSKNTLWKKSRDAALLKAAVPTTSVPSVPMTEVECMKLACDEELARMKKQYVQGLIEYKRLVIEQYERRQSQIHEYHRAEIESMIVLVQEKFKREIEKHGENMLRAKESLKLLYRAMKMDGDSLFDRLSSVPSAAEEAPKIPEEAVPLKSLLRAAVFAMSNSKKRNNVATKQINDIYNTAKEKKEKDAFNRQAKCELSGSNSPPLSAVPSTTVIQTTKTMPAIEERPPTRERHPALLFHVGCQGRQ